MGLDPRWRVYRVRRRFMGDGRAYEVGDQIELATLLSWRNGVLLAEQHFVAPALPSKETVTAQRRAAGHKSRESGQDFKELVRRAGQWSIDAGIKQVREVLLNPKILTQLTQNPTRLSIVAVRAGRGRRGLRDDVGARGFVDWGDASRLSLTHQEESLGVGVLFFALI